MFSWAPVRVFSGTRPPHPVQEATRAGDGSAQAVEVAQLAGGDADQGDEVVGLPEPVDVALAEADAAAQRAAPGGRVVDGDGGAQLGVGGAEAAAAPALDHLDPPVAHAAAHHRGDGGPGQRVPHGETNPFGLRPSGWGK